MKLRKFFGPAVGIWLLLAALAGAQAQMAPATSDRGEAAARTARVQERESLRRERETIDKMLQQAESACYQRFAVENCLSQARRDARAARAQIRQRELVLEGAERRERAAQRLSDVQERESTRVSPAPHQGAVADRPSQAERDQQAAQRAQAQQEALAAHQASQAAQIKARADGAAQARQSQEKKRQAAQQRRVRVLQSQADRDAAGRKAPKPLPAVP